MVVLGRQLQLGELQAGLVPRVVKAAFSAGVRPCVELHFSDGRTLTCTGDHRLLTAEGQWVTAAKLVVGQSEIAVRVEGPRVDREGSTANSRLEMRRAKSQWMADRGQRVNRLAPICGHYGKGGGVVPLRRVRLIVRRDVGVHPVFDLTVPGDFGDLDASFVANGVVAHNCIAELEVPLTFKLQFLEEAAAEKRKMKKGRKGGQGGGGQGGGQGGGGGGGNGGGSGGAIAASNLLTIGKGGQKGTSPSSHLPYSPYSTSDSLSSASASSRSHLDDLVLSQRKELTNFFCSISVEEKWLLTEMSTAELSDIISSAPEWETLRAALESYSKYAWEEDVLEISDDCFPETDTRVLTDTGFLFLHQLEDRFHQGESPLFACYDLATKAPLLSTGPLGTATAFEGPVDLQLCNQGHAMDEW